MTAPILSLKGVTKRYTGNTGTVSQVLGGIDLDVMEGEFIAILGFSGAGKTTLISAIAGLVEPDSGEMLLRGEAITGPSRDRGFPHRDLGPPIFLSSECTRTGRPPLGP